MDTSGQVPKDWKKLPNNHIFKVGDLVRFKGVATHGVSWWGYVYDDKPNGHHVYIHWFYGGPSGFDPFHAAELKDDLVLVAKA